MISCKLINEGGASMWDGALFECEQVPRTGELIVMKWPHDPTDWGAALKVQKVVYRSGEKPHIHVKYHCNERHL